MFSHFNGLSSRWWSFMVDHNRNIFHLWRNESAQMDTYQRICSYILYAVTWFAVPCHAMPFCLFFWLSCTRWSFTVFVLLHTCAAVIGATNFAIYCFIQRQRFDTQSEQKWRCGRGGKGGSFWFMWTSDWYACVGRCASEWEIDYDRPTDWKNVTLISIFKRSPYHYDAIELHYMAKLFVTNIFDECSLLKKKNTIYINFDGKFF